MVLTLTHMLSAVYLLLVPSSFFFFFSPPLLLSFQWACLEITHNAQPHKLTDSCSGVIRCEDRITQYPISIKISRHSFSDLMLLPSHVCVINNDSTTSRRCLRYIPVLDFTPPPPLPPPSVSPASHPLWLKHAYLLPLSGVTKGYIPHLQHICRIEMPNAALFLFLF